MIRTCLIFLLLLNDVLQAQPDSAALTFKYGEVPLGAIKPGGWIKHQLQLMRDGSTGHLDEVYAKVKNDNGWLGGAGDGWEETPYWLDGALPLAYLLEDRRLQEKVLRYINWTLKNQRPSGYFGPITKWERSTNKQITAADCDKGEDWWPKMIMLKVLQQYYSATRDPQVILFMTKYFQFQQQTLNKCRLNTWTEWAESRGADNILVVQWLYNITRDPELLKLADLIQSQAFRWSDWFYGREWVMNAAAHQDEKAWMRRHGVNVSMGIKDPAVHFNRTGEKKYFEALKKGWSDLMLLHGMPYGLFSADEDLHGNDPTQGTELCAIVESMFSLEQAIAITGDMEFMDALERMTYNALPAQTTDDYNNKQYFQIANQVHVARGVFNFSLPFARGMNNVYGMRSGYTCCLANMHQGWTKFTSHLWYTAPGNGIAAVQYAPNVLKLALGKSNKEVTVTEFTSYPFGDTISFRIKMQGSQRFPFHLRIPSWCDTGSITLNGKLLRRENGGKMVELSREWNDGDRLVLHLPMKVTVSRWGRNSRAVERGPLVYALKLSEQWKEEEDEKEGRYYTITTPDNWNYGLVDSALRHIDRATVSMRKIAGDDFVWNLENAPIEINISGKQIPDWKIVNGVAPQPVTARDGLYMGRVEEEVHELTLVPYGCTKVRVVAFPVVK
jgi:uncharacterized protein